MIGLVGDWVGGWVAGENRIKAISSSKFKFKLKLKMSLAISTRYSVFGIEASR